MAQNIGILTGPGAGRRDRERSSSPTAASRPTGTYSAAFPLHDGTGRMLVSWSQCRVLENNHADALHGEPAGGAGRASRRRRSTASGSTTRRPARSCRWCRRVESVIFTDVVALEPRALPPVIFDKEDTGELDPDLLAEGVGLLKIRSVYDVDGAATRNIAALADPAQTTADQRPARFLRLEKAVAIPDDDRARLRPRRVRRRWHGLWACARSSATRWWSPTAPSTSRCRPTCRWRSACSTARAGASRARHQNWLQLRPGEVRTCNGCHDPGSGAVARARRCVRERVGRRSARRPAIPEHQSGDLRRHRRDHGRGAGAGLLRDGLRGHHAERRRALRRCLDRRRWRPAARPMRASPTATRT